MTNENLIQTWYNDITKQPFKKSEKTRDEYLKSINYFLEFVNKDIIDITQRDVKLYMQSLNVSDSTYNNRLASISSLYKVLSYSPITEELIKINPTKDVFRVSVKNKEKKPLTQDEERALLQNCKNKRVYAILLLMLSNGLRIDELINLKLEQYVNRDEDNGIKLVHTKRSKIRMTYLNDNVIRAIDDYLTVRKDGCDFLFVSNSGETPLLRTSLTRTFKNIARRSNMFSEERIGQIAPHLMRCTCASALAENDIPVQVIQKILGHSDISCTMKYVKTSNDSVRNAMVGYAIEERSKI